MPTVPDRREVLVKERLACAARVTTLGVRNKHPVAQPLRLLGRDLIVPLVSVVGKGDENERRREHGRTFDANVALEEVDREIHPALALAPRRLQPLDRETAYR